MEYWGSFLVSRFAKNFRGPCGLALSLAGDELARFETRRHRSSAASQPAMTHCPGVRSAGRFRTLRLICGRARRLVGDVS